MVYNIQYNTTGLMPELIGVVYTLTLLAP